MRTALMVAAMMAAGGLASAQAPAAAAARLTLTTDAGTIEIKLRPDLAPNHVRHVVKTARAGGYDGTTFHRIIAGGIIQGGDPLTKDPKNAARYGSGGLGLLKAEFSETPFTRGVVAAARRPSSNDSGGSQFFICLSDQPGLKGQYTVFGEVTSGMEAADAIGQTPLQDGKPTIRVVIKKATAE
ncbi:MAG TPA: peptidylprolyl isomerase [Vicinamibacteria bacterium]|nr:peptidylprolyl isomerase [Vicinamibacteria bacterium]